MSSKRWSYKVVQIKPKFLGMRPEAVELELNQQGQAGWELVQVIQHGLLVWLYLKKDL